MVIFFSKRRKTNDGKNKLVGALDESSADHEIYKLLLYINCEKSGGLHLAVTGLMVGSLAENFWARLAVDRNIRFSFLLSQGTVLLQQL